MKEQSDSGSLSFGYDSDTNWSMQPSPGLLSGYQQPAASDEPRYVPELNEGDSVKHKVFGIGTIVELEGDVATIFFKGKGAKKLNISFAPLEKVET
jgi:DNA helicase-2/ATP-dependent DNA helicase PcrA